MLGLPADVLAIVDDPTQQRHLEIASGTIDSYLRSQYTLPITADPGGLFPPSLVTACVYIASYTIIQFIGYNPNNADSRYESRYHDMIGNPNVSGSSGWLDKLASGAVSLDITVDATPTVNEGAPSVATNVERGWGLDVFGRKNTTFI